MSNPEQPPGQACGIVNLLIPVFLAGGGVTGWVVGHGFGVVWAILGAVVGFFLGVPVLGIFLMILARNCRRGRLVRRAAGAITLPATS